MSLMINRFQINGVLICVHPDGSSNCRYVLAYTSGSISPKSFCCLADVNERNALSKNLEMTYPNIVQEVLGQCVYNT